jgi:phosphate transport system permease protein
MPVVIAAVVVLGALGFALGVRRARILAGGISRALHSRTAYHGAFVAIATILPALIAIGIWQACEAPLIDMVAARDLTGQIAKLDAGDRSLTLSSVRMVADGLRTLTNAELADVTTGKVSAADMFAAKGIAVATAPGPEIVQAALHRVALQAASRMALTLVAFGLALSGLLFGLWRISPAFRSRNVVESVMRGGLMASSLVAILTTIGIVLSMLFETLRFFDSVTPASYFFGLVWDPRFTAAGASGGSQGQFGLLPLLWGTIFISLMALLIAVPAGLMSAIYMAEYAPPRLRMLAKPLLEILAGIPTIIYGFFALVTFGPFLRDLGASVGLTISATSVLSAGFVMGVMLIPFVSSLADDILTAVPQSLREGSYGLGATHSETIKRVVLPAALPGIVGAILLAASRAVGETMIVVLAAGIAANLTLNPFEPVTTITVKIVSQLTGDLEFNSPQTLVAFALGLTLFVITLVLNIYALYIVRKYKEQYE